MVGEPGSVDVRAETFALTEFFPLGVVDIAATFLAGEPSEIVVIECDESGTTARLTRAELRQRVAALAATLRDHGIRQGDIVAGLSTTSEPTLTMMLAAAACGAVYTTTSAEFGAAAVIDRLSQVRPKALLVVGQYRFAGKEFDIHQRLDEVVATIDSIELIITTGTTDPDRFASPASERHITSVPFIDAVSDATAALVTQPVAFNAPGWILYSSGTTGKPKCIVHRAGGVVLKHLSEMLLHCDIRRGDRVFYYTTPSWMMWNWLVSGLGAGACVVLFSGSPLAPEPTQLLTMADREAVTYFGTVTVLPRGAEASRHRPDELRALCRSHGRSDRCPAMLQRTPSSPHHGDPMCTY